MRIDRANLKVSVANLYLVPPVLTTHHITCWANQLVSGFLRHSLTLLLLVMLLFVLLPFLAPLFMALEWYGAARLVYEFYALTCHQLPQRSWFLFGEKLTYSLDEIRQIFPYSSAWDLRSFVGTPQMGWKVAWSDRMLSFYAMVPIFGLFYALRRHCLPKPISLQLLLLTLLPIFLDGVTHTLNDVIAGVASNGFRDTNAWLSVLTNQAFPGFYDGDHFGTFNWWMRLVTGLMAAWGMAFFLFPWLDKILHEEAAHQADSSASSILRHESDT